MIDVKQPGQAGDLTEHEALQLAAVEVLRWEHYQDEDWQGHMTAARIFAIYGRVRRANNMP